MPLLPQSIIIGSWRVAKTEVPPDEEPLPVSDERFLHFTADWRHFWEHPLSENRVLRAVSEFRYRMTEYGVFISPYIRRTGHVREGWEIPFTQEGEFLVVPHPKTTRRWWLRRILPAERPDFLTHYYDPPQEIGV